MFKVEIRTTCKVCAKPITERRFRSYCGAKCRNHFFNLKYSKEHTDWQRNRRDREAIKPSPNKVQCLVCKKWYVQVCSHVYQVHGVTGREYREAHDLERKRGVLPAWYRELKGEIAINNGTYNNLKAGKRFWFTKGDKRAGRYKRSHVTMARLKVLNKLRKK